MKYIAELAYEIKSEVEGAKEYAEKYVYYKVQNNMSRAKVFLEMSQDELKHAKYIHEICLEEINRLKDVYKPTNEMMEMWDNIHKEYVEEFAWVKQMLAM